MHTPVVCVAGINGGHVHEEVCFRVRVAQRLFQLKRWASARCSMTARLALAGVFSLFHFPNPRVPQPPPLSCGDRGSSAETPISSKQELPGERKSRRPYPLGISDTLICTDHQVVMKYRTQGISGGPYRNTRMCSKREHA